MLFEAGEAVTIMMGDMALWNSAVNWLGSLQNGVVDANHADGDAACQIVKVSGRKSVADAKIAALKSADQQHSNVYSSVRQISFLLLLSTILLLLCV